MSESTDQLIAELSRDLPAVRSIPSLTAMTGWTLASSAPLGVALVLWTGVRPDLRAGGPPELWIVTGLSLLLVAAGGLVSSLAGPVPGRQRAEQAGTLIAVAGALIAVLALLRLFGLTSTLFDAAELGSTVACTAIALLVALPPLACTTYFQWRAAPRSRNRTAALAGAASVAIAGVVVHYWCQAAHPIHLVFGHAAAPLVGAALFVATTFCFWRATARARR